MVQLVAAPPPGQCRSTQSALVHCHLTSAHEGPHAAAVDQTTIVTWDQERTQRWRADNPPPWIVGLPWSHDFVPWRRRGAVPQLDVIINETAAPSAERPPSVANDSLPASA